MEELEVRDVFACLEASPGMLERLIHPLTVAGIVPSNLRLRKTRDNLLISFCIEGITANKLEMLVARMKAMPYVRRASIVRKWRASKS